MRGRDLRLFGDVGAFAGDTATDLVSGTAFTGGVTLATTGISITDTTTTEFVDDAQSPIKRKVLYNISTGDSFTLQFGSTINFDSFGFMSVAGYTDPNMEFQVETSPDGMGWTNVLTQSGGIVPYQNFFNLTQTTGDYLRVTILNALAGDQRMSDLFVFGSITVPEPSALMLLAAGAWAMFRRRT